MNIVVTFPHPLSRVTRDEIEAVLAAAGVSLTISSVSLETNILTLAADRQLTPQEEIAVRAAFAGAFPRFSYA